ncbi:MAG: flagellar filament capping protein FliD [Bacteroidetes bacterium]|nr:flagellar filament capping protein FliD [Bacteroidota bacterium]MCL5738512.1 flagellar filament capping protein FliD [Bacteroidota bacterium]
MSSSISSLNGGQSSAIDQLVAQYTASISQPVYQLQMQQSQISSSISTYQDVKTKLANLQTQANSLSAVGSLSPLAAKTASSSNSAIVTATAQSTATSGTHSLLVTQLAKYDTLVSSQLTQTGTDISTATGAGAFTFSVTVNGTATNVNVTVNAGDTNSTVMANMASAVNAANIGVTASVVNDTSSTARLVFTSKSSGSTNAVSVADVTGNLAASVGWTSSVISGRTASTSTGAGFVNSSVNSLDANFTLDGISIVRGSNTVTDVLTGVTLNLAGTQLPTDNPVTLTVSADTTSIQSTIQNFINTYNTVITTLNSDITTNSQTQVRGPLAGDVSFMNLQLSLQNILMGQVSSAKSGNPNTLSAIGITLNKDGTLTISNQSTLTSTLNSNPTAVSDLFSSSNGVAVQLNTLVSSFSNPGGVMDQKINGAQDQISMMNDQISSMQASINLQAEAMRQQFTAYQSMLIQLTQTQSTMNNIWQGMASSGMAV